MLDKYLSLLDDLIKLRESNKGTESDEEDRLLDDMDLVWEKMTEEERTQVQKLPSKSKIN